MKINKQIKNVPAKRVRKFLSIKRSNFLIRIIGTKIAEIRKLSALFEIF